MGKNYDVIIIGAGPGGIFSAYELIKTKHVLRVAVFEKGHSLEDRKCPIDGVKIKTVNGTSYLDDVGNRVLGSQHIADVSHTDDFGVVRYHRFQHVQTQDAIV